MLYRPRLTAGVAATLATLLGTAGACRATRKGAAPPPAIVFVNQSLNQADVYAVSSGAGQVRIGTVMPGRTEVLRLRAASGAAMSGVNIVARIVSSSRAPRTERLTLLPGDRLQVTLPLAENTLIVLPVAEPAPEP